MAFCEIKYFSPALQKAAAADVVLPDPGVPPPFFSLYLLHGLSDDNTMWQRRTSIERYVAGLPLIVVMPDGGRGFYCDAQVGMAWETAIVRDLVDYIDSLFHTRASADGRSVAGLSMGGYGAAKFALKYPERFAAGVSHSGALGFAHRELAPAENTWSSEFSRIVGERPAGGPDDLYAISSGLEPARRPALRIDCGTEDFLIEDNRGFHAHLNEIGFPHEYVEHSGAHNWQYWDRHIVDTIQFICGVLGIAGFDPAAHRA
jgi:S-formylglutathione hydrolase FrmB